MSDDTLALNGATGWVNSTTPLGKTELRGRVVLVNFWTLTCINWIRTAPYVRAWSRAYSDAGLTVIGVHTPEFSIEHDTAAVERATLERGIDYPVAIDNNYEIWNAFHNRYWPALYFLGEDGSVADSHFGEGEYEKCEGILQRLLGVRRPFVSVEGTGVEAPPDWANLRTPETYLGYERGTGYPFQSDVVTNQVSTFTFPADLALNTWALSGKWVIGGESITQQSAGASLALRFHARDVHLVMAPGIAGDVAFQVLLDERVPGAAHGVDVDPQGRGTVRDGRLYQLVRTTSGVHEHVLRIIFEGTGARAFNFTFG